jgi:serine/threonine-protein kinase HipA
LPLQAGPQFHRKSKDGSLFPAAIADTEPDGWARRVILRDHIKRRQELRRNGKEGETEPLDALDYLLAVDDFSRVGALRFRDENGMFQRAQEEGRRTAPPLIELGHLLSASRAVEANKETAADLAYLRGRGTSLGGMRPKCTVIDDDGALSIGKFPSITDERAVTKGEVLALTLARKAGINAAAACIVQSEDLPVALIRRFDRTGNGDRIMYVSAATMLGVEVAEPEEHTYTEIVDAIRVHGADAQSDIEELWRRIAFSILITNVDDHLRNHGFLHVDREFWRLSPAFDINPSPERVRELKTWISEDAGPDMTIDALMSVISYFRITKTRARMILSEVAYSVENWRTTGQSIGMSDEELEPFVEAFEHVERRAAKRF